MCNICRKFICPPACPSYEGRSSERGLRVAVCRICGEFIYRGGGRFLNDRHPLCFDCYLRERRARALAARPLKKHT